MFDHETYLEWQHALSGFIDICIILIASYFAMSVIGTFIELVVQNMGKMFILVFHAFIVGMYANMLFNKHILKKERYK